MTDQKKAPERIWAWNKVSGGLSFSVCPAGKEIEYVRADLLEAAKKRIAELEVHAENGWHQYRHWSNRYLEVSAERDQALAASAAREIAMRDRAEGWLWEYMGTKMHGLYVKGSMSNALPLSPDGQQALDDVRADAWEDGWLHAKNGGLGPNPHRKGGS